MIDSTKVEEARRVFTQHPQNRKELKAMLEHKTFKKALSVLELENRHADQLMEAAGMSADPIVSVRLNSQRIARAQLIDDLYALTETPREKGEDIPANFQPENDQV